MNRKAPGPGQWLIAAGYLLVAVIVLANHILQRSDTRTRRLTGTVLPVYEDADVLRRQLTEERQKNTEMAGMIRRLQSNYVPAGESSPALAAQPTAAAVGAGEQGTSMPVVPLLLTGSVTSGLASDPFLPGKNPFRAFYASREGGPSRARMLADPPRHPVLPRLMLGGVNHPSVISPR